MIPSWFNVSAWGHDVRRDSWLAITCVFALASAVGIKVVLEMLVAGANQFLLKDEKIERSNMRGFGVGLGEMTRAYEVHRANLPDSRVRVAWFVVWDIFVLSLGAGALTMALS
jgi:hypothetical protein